MTFLVMASSHYLTNFHLWLSQSSNSIQGEWQINIKETVKSTYSKYHPYLPAIAFSGGFIWDVVTLGFKINPFDLFILLAYYLGAIGCMLIVGRGVQFKYSQYTNLLLQFFLGGIFSALVVFYFKSSESLMSYLLVFVLIVLLVLNEFLDKAYSRMSISWAMFTFCGIMFFNFAIPHLLASINSIWFLLSTVLGIAIPFFLRKLCTKQKGSFKPSITVAVTIILLFWLGWIPPVPLVKKNMLICHNLKRSEQQYIGAKEVKVWYKKLSFGKQLIHKKEGEKIFCFSSIFAPSGISTTIYHHWEYYSEKSGEWQDQDLMGFSIHSGRETGYRGFTYKKNMEEGVWRVKVKLQNGQILGIKKFKLKYAASDSLRLQQIVLE